MKNNFDTIKDEIFYLYVAPDGTPQVGTMGNDMAECVAMAKLYHKAGIGLSPHKMKIAGFNIRKVRVSIEALDDTEEQIFQEAKNSL